ncbi:MAG: thioredoxin domain-containing protein [Anaerolineales bacterium]
MTNALVHSSSPYLRQHAENPVDWLPWGGPAFEKAAREDKPIFLSIGYAACHWCHVMARESFEDRGTADLLNQFFVSIKVDREERPDIDSIYMEAVLALTGQGGWPLSVFLAPDGRPFLGGTYFPPVPRHGLPSFRDLLQDVARAWKESRAALLERGSTLASELKNRPDLATAPAVEMASAQLDRAMRSLLRDFDVRHGGWGNAPKFPQATAIEFLMRQNRRGQEELALDPIRRALLALARGAIRDQVGGGFHRYATDAAWRVPHFEKMLCDNALLTSAFLHAWLATREPEFRDAAEDALRFMGRELLLGEGGFASSLDADSDGGEGRYYLWSAREVRDALGSAADLGLRLFGVREEGPFEGRNVLFLAESPDQVIGTDTGGDATWSHVAALRRALLSRRQERPRPNRDEKVIASWNGLALSAFSEAARILGSAAFLDLARRNAEFLSTALLDEGRARHSWFAGKATSFGFLEDQVGLAAGFLEYYQTTFDERYFQMAVDLCDQALLRFRRVGAGFYDTADDHEPLLTRPSNLQDQALPSANALACTVLLKLYALTGKANFLDPVEESLPRALAMAARFPMAFGQWLVAADLYLEGVTSVALVGPAAEDLGERGEMLRLLHQEYWPNLVVAFRDANANSLVPGLNEKPMRDGRPSAYVCAGTVCYPAVVEVSQLKKLLRPALLAARPGEPTGS